MSDKDGTVGAAGDDAGKNKKTAGKALLQAESGTEAEEDVGDDEA